MRDLVLFTRDYVIRGNIHIKRGRQNSVNDVLRAMSSCRGQTPEQADFHYLENAKKLAMYGVDMHLATVSDAVASIDW